MSQTPPPSPKRLRSSGSLPNISFTSPETHGNKKPRNKKPDHETTNIESDTEPESESDTDPVIDCCADMTSNTPESPIPAAQASNAIATSSTTPSSSSSTPSLSSSSASSSSFSGTPPNINVASAVASIAALPAPNGPLDWKEFLTVFLSTFCAQNSQQSNNQSSNQSASTQQKRIVTPAMLHSYIQVKFDDTKHCVKTFFLNYERACDHLSASSKERLSLLPVVLDEAPTTFFNNILDANKSITYEAMKMEFLRQFNVPIRATARTLEAIVPRDNHTVEEYIQFFIQEAQLRVPHGVTEEFKAMTLVSKLPDYMHPGLLGTPTDPPLTFAEVKRRANHFLYNKVRLSAGAINTIASSMYPTTSYDRNNNSDDLIAAIRDLVSNNNRQQSQPTNPSQQSNSSSANQQQQQKSKRQFCRYCKKPGHSVPQCHLRIQRVLYRGLEDRYPDKTAEVLKKWQPKPPKNITPQQNQQPSVQPQYQPLQYMPQPTMQTQQAKPVQHYQPQQLVQPSPQPQRLVAAAIPTQSVSQPGNVNGELHA